MIQNGDLLWMKRVRDVSTVKLGDIVTFYSPTESEKVLLTKKITATVCINKNRIIDLMVDMIINLII